MSRKAVPLKSHANHSFNPFMVSMVCDLVSGELPTKQKYVKNKLSNQSIVDTDSGEVTPQKILILGERTIVDQSDFVKLYSEQIELFFDLSRTDAKVLKMLIKAAKYDKDIIFINALLLSKQLAVTRQTIYNSISILITKGIIAKADLASESYYINPKIFFKGDRLVLVKEFQTKNSSDCNSCK